MSTKRQLIVAVIFVLLVLFSFVTSAGFLAVQVWENQIYCWLVYNYSISYTVFLRALLTVSFGLLTFDSLIIFLYSVFSLYELRIEKETARRTKKDNSRFIPSAEKLRRGK